MKYFILLHTNLTFQSGSGQLQCKTMVHVIMQIVCVDIYKAIDTFGSWFVIFVHVEEEMNDLWGILHFPVEGHC